MPKKEGKKEYLAVKIGKAPKEAVTIGEATKPVLKPISAGEGKGKLSTLLIRQAWVTENASDLSNLRKYTFIVDREANKPEIEKAIRLIYGVKVSDINIINTKGKAKRLGRSLGRTKTHKKAIVTLREGEKIDIIPA